MSGKGGWSAPVRLQNVYNADKEQQPLAFPTHCWDSPHSEKRERKENRCLVYYTMPSYPSYYIIHSATLFLRSYLFYIIVFSLEMWGKVMDMH